MNVRLQTTGAHASAERAHVALPADRLLYYSGLRSAGEAATAVLQEGLADLREHATHIKATFVKASSDFDSRQ